MANTVARSCAPTMAALAALGAIASCNQKTDTPPTAAAAVSSTQLPATGLTVRAEAPRSHV